MITIQETGPDWEPTKATHFYAQREDNWPPGFGSTEEEALKNLLELEKSDAN